MNLRVRVEILLESGIAHVRTNLEKPPEMIICMCKPSQGNMSLMIIQGFAELIESRGVAMEKRTPWSRLMRTFLTATSVLLGLDELQSPFITNVL